MENEIKMKRFRDILSFGIKPKQRILHLGCGDKETNFIENMHNINPNIFYLGVDVDIDIIEGMKQKYADIPTYSFENITLQDFLDYTMYGLEGSLQFEHTIITGIFDKPVYKENQHIFISTVVQRCLQFSDSIIFTIDENNYRDYNYSVLYVINNLISTFDNVQMKKKSNQYIFCITY